MVRSTAVGTWKKNGFQRGNVQRSSMSETRATHMWPEFADIITDDIIEVQHLLSYIFISFYFVLCLFVRQNTTSGLYCIDDSCPQLIHQLLWSLQTCYSKIRLQRASMFFQANALEHFGNTEIFRFSTSNGMHHDIACFSCLVWETTSWPIWLIVRLRRTFFNLLHPYWVYDPVQRTALNPDWNSFTVTREDLGRRQVEGTPCHCFIWLISMF